MASSPTIDSEGVVRLTVHSGGQALDESIGVVSIDTAAAVNSVPRATIVLLDGSMPEGKFPLGEGDSFKPGAEIRITAGYGRSGDEATLFEGIVIRHGLKIAGDNYARLVVECRDKAVRMTVGRKNANHVDLTDSDVIKKLIEAHGLKAKVDATNVTYRELVQYYCTDWDYMMCRAEVNGLQVIAQGGEVAVAAPDTGASPVLSVTYGEDLMEFHADVDAASQLESVKAVSWDLATQAVVEGDGAAPSLNEQGDLEPSALAKVLGLDVYRLQTAAPMDQQALKSWADSQRLKAGLARIRGRMTFQGSARALPGALISVAGVGSRFEGNVFASSVRHHLRDGNWTTEVEFGMPSAAFAERPDVVAPPASGWLPGIEGLQIGVVTKLDEDPDQEQKVQVTVPVMQAETEGVWARIAGFHASEGVGAFFVPEVGDEVVLGYLNGDPSHPVILGSLYSSKRTPPAPLTADNFIKMIKTRSELTLQFDDEKKVITVVTPGGNTIVVSDDEKSILLQDENGNKMELSSDGIALSSPKDIKLTAQGKVTIDGTGGIDVTSKADVKVGGLNINNDAKVGFVAKGSASAELSATGQTKIAGAMVMIN